MKITYDVYESDGVPMYDSNARLIRKGYQTLKAAKRLAQVHRTKTQLYTSVVEMIKDRGEEPYGNIMCSYFPSKGENS